MASFSCQCGDVTVTCSSTQPRTCVVCCCCDCFQRYEWTGSFRGSQLDESQISKRKGIRGEHWSAKMTISKGKNNLVYNKLNGVTQSRFCVANCCKTILFFDNPAYSKNVVYLNPDMVKFQQSTRSDIPVMANTFTNDWSQEDQKNLSNSVPNMYITDGQFAGTGDWEAARDELFRQFSIPPEGEGQLFDELLDECGGVVTNLGFHPRVSHDFH